jgi:hypothetical protein
MLKNFSYSGGGTGVWIQDFKLVRQVFYPLSQNKEHFFLWNNSDYNMDDTD